MASHRDGRPVIPDQREADFIGLENADTADLVLFMAGNQFMAMPDLLAAFQKAHPPVHSIFCETLPPRLELEQILAGGAWFRDTLIDVPADLFASVSNEGVRKLATAGKTNASECTVYLHNRLALMVPAGNPADVRTPSDLGREGVIVSQPNPSYEDIAEHCLAMYRAAGGRELEQRIMVEKLQGGETMLTTVHHRETPERLLQGSAHAGPVWATEIINARRLGWSLEGVDLDPGVDQRDAVNYTICPLADGRNPENGAAFARFLLSDVAQNIFLSHGFTPARC